MLYRLIPLLLFAKPFSCSNVTFNNGTKEALRIFKGSKVNIIDYPHAVLLFFQITRPASCGGSLITDKTILTNAYCAEERTLRDGHITAYLGSSIPRWSTVMRDIIAHKIHPDYNRKEFKYNLAVLLMNHPVPMGDTIQPIALGSELMGHIGVVVGWGRQSMIPNEPGKIPPDRKLRELSKSTQEIIEKNKCEPIVGYALGPATICTKAMKGRLVHLDELGDGLLFINPRHSLIGVLSCVRNSIAVFSSVSFSKDWINYTAYQF